jgi:hypothetical protein
MWTTQIQPHSKDFQFDSNFSPRKFSFLLLLTSTIFRHGFDGNHQSINQGATQIGDLRLPIVYIGCEISVESS